jgi:predicted transposase YbfD/YdcC
MADIQRIGLDEVVRHFEQWEDPRSTVNRQHPLVSVVVIALMAVLDGASGPTAIAKWAALKQEFLLKTLNLPNGIPRQDVFRRVLAALKPGAVQACVANGLQSLRATAAVATGVEPPVLAVDGKTARRSHDRKNGLGALPCVSVWASDFGLALGPGACAATSNAITALPELLRLVDLRGALMLHHAVIASIDHQSANGVAGVKARRHQTRETGPGRAETRRSLQMPVPKELPGLPVWNGLKSIGVGVGVSQGVRTGKETVEVRYDISSLGVSVQRCAHAVRSHWGLENTCHWRLDVTDREDESRIRDKPLRDNCAWLNRLTLSRWKQHPGPESLARKRRSCGWSDEFLLEVLAGATL